MTAEPQGEEQSMNSLRAFSKSVGTSVTVATSHGVSLNTVQVQTALPPRRALSSSSPSTTDVGQAVNRGHRQFQEA